MVTGFWRVTVYRAHERTPTPMDGIAETEQSGILALALNAKITRPEE